MNEIAETNRLTLINQIAALEALLTKFKAEADR